MEGWQARESLAGGHRHELAVPSEPGGWGKPASPLQSLPGYLYSGHLGREMAPVMVSNASPPPPNCPSLPVNHRGPKLTGSSQ